MRTIIYAVLNKGTKKKTVIGWNLFEAQERMEEMKNADPSADLAIVYKYKSF